MFFHLIRIRGQLVKRTVWRASPEVQQCHGASKDKMKVSLAITEDIVD